MCGIFGWLDWKQTFNPDQLCLAEAATMSLLHRGPDAGDSWHDDHVFMGHRRLKIIDLSDTANQPFTDPSGRYALSYNGEVYNYLEIRQELEAIGISFTTNSDTEVVLLALIYWGEAALARFDGMFALALHDKVEDVHFLARDSMGQKPLYFYLNDDQLLYASELRGLLSVDRFDWSIDPKTVRRYLMNSYFAGSDTPILGVKKLLPGSWLRFSKAGATEGMYWHSVPGQDIADVSDEDAVSELGHLLDQSCARSLRTDVPFGVFLSGGLDSSLILHSCKKENPSVRAFSVAMSEQDFDESDKAAQVAAFTKVEEHKTFVMDERRIVEALDYILDSSDEPLADPGYINSYFLAASCRPYLTVGLAGDGGDELFAGYAPFQGLRVAPYLDAVPDFAINTIKAAVRSIPESDGYLSCTFKAKAYLKGFPADRPEKFALWLSALEPDQLKDLGYKDESHASGHLLGSDIAQLLSQTKNHSLTQQLVHFYQKVFLPEFISAHTDRAAMQTSLEVRSPFLSTELIQFANRLPDRLRAPGGNLKYLLRCLAERQGFPDAIYQQRKKGFTFPIARWLKGSLKPKMMHLLDKAKNDDELFDREYIDQLIKRHLDGRENNYRIIFNIMCYEAWRQKYPSLKYGSTS